MGTSGSKKPRWRQPKSKLEASKTAENKPVGDVTTASSTSTWNGHLIGWLYINIAVAPPSLSHMVISGCKKNKMATAKMQNWGFKTGVWHHGHKIIWNQFTEGINKVRSRLIFIQTDFFLQPVEPQVTGCFWKRGNRRRVQCRLKCFLLIPLKTSWHVDWRNAERVLNHHHSRAELHQI